MAQQGQASQRRGRENENSLLVTELMRLPSEDQDDEMEQDWGVILRITRLIAKGEGERERAVPNWNVLTKYPVEINV